MPYPVEFLDCNLDPTNFFQSPTTSILGTLPIGGSGQVGDKRVIILFEMSSTFAVSSLSAGWTATSMFASGGGGYNVIVISQVITSSSVDGTFIGYAGGSNPSGFMQIEMTLRNWSVSQVWSSATVTSVVASGTSPLNINTTSVSVAAGSVHVNMDWVESATSTLYTKTLGIPTGYTQLAPQANSQGASGQDVLYALVAKTYSSAGSTGTISSPYSVTYYNGSIGLATTAVALSIVLAQNPDVTATIGTASETPDAAAVLTPTIPNTQTHFTIGTATETDAAAELFTPLTGTRVSDPKPLGGGPVVSSRVSWQASTPAPGSTVKVETSINAGLTWQVAVNGAAVPNLLPGNTSAPSVMSRVTLNRVLSTDASPTVSLLDVEVAIDSTYNEMVSLGVFLITQVDITESGGTSGGGASGSGGSGNGVTGSGGTSTGGGLSVTLSGIDLSYQISRNTWDEIFYVPAGTNYADAIEEIIANRAAGGLNFNFASTEHLTQSLFLFGTTQGNDAWQDAQDLATAIGYETYFDPNGVPVLRPIPNPSLSPTVWVVEDTANPTMVSYTRSMTDATTYNKVIVQGESTGNAAPVTATAEDLDPASVTYTKGPYGVVTTIFTSALIGTVDQAQQVADALLNLVKGASETVQIDMVPNPALEPGDVIAVYRTFNGQKIIQGTFLINSISTPLAPGQAQTLVCYRQSPGAPNA